MGILVGYMFQKWGCRLHLDEFLEVVCMHAAYRKKPLVMDQNHARKPVLANVNKNQI